MAEANRLSLNMSESKTSILFMSYGGRTLDLLQSVEYYCRSPLASSFIDRIIVVWNSAEKYRECDEIIGDQIDQILHYKDSLNFCHHQRVDRIDIDLIQTGTNVLWSRWSIDSEKHIRTESVIVMDDDERFHTEYLLCLFNAWRSINVQGEAPKVLVRDVRAFHRITDDDIANGMMEQLLTLPDHYKAIPPDGRYPFRYSYEWDRNCRIAIDQRHPEKPCGWHMGLPTGTVVPTKILREINGIFNEFQLKPIIENQSAMCDDIAFSLSILHFFQKTWPGKKPFVYHRGGPPAAYWKHSNKILEKFYILKSWIFGDGDSFFDFTGEAPCNKGGGVAESQSRDRYLFRSECLNVMVSKFPNDPVLTHSHKDAVESPRG